MADPQQNYRDVLSRLKAEDEKGMSAQDVYDAASFLPGTGEAIAAYELPGILSQSGEMISSDDFVEAAKGTGLATLGIASVLPIVGPAAKAARKGLEGFIPYMGPKLATEGPDSSIMAMTDFEPPKGGTKVADDIDLGSGSLFAPESKKGRQLLVLSCSSTKCPDVGDMKAVDRYLGPVFQSLKKQGVPDNVDVAILSAKHGLIKANTKIKDYDQLMDTNRASEFKQDAGQMDRIKNTLEGYDKVVVQGGKNYKDVIRAAAGGANITEIPGGRGIGDQRKSVKSALAFSKIDTPVYHYTPDAELGFTVFDPDKSPNVLDALGTHVGTAKAARDRFKTLQRSNLVTGNLGRDEAGNLIPRTTRGGTYPLNADLSKPYTPDKFFEGQVSGAGPSKEVWGESDIYQHLLDEYNKKRDTRYSMRSFVGDEPDFPFSDFRKFIGEFRRKLAEDGFTHLPYYNEVEDYGSMSYVMLTDRPKGSTKVLQSPFAKKDPAAADDPDIMKAEGGVVSMKNKAVNINRGPRGIEPFVQYFEDGGVVQTIQDYIGSFFEEESPAPERNIFEEQRVYNPVVEEGIARAIQGREMDEKLARYGQEGALSQRVAASMRKRGERPLNPFEKNLGLQDDPYAKLSVPASYQTGVEFGDMETGFDLLNQLDFNKVLLAGLRDNRTLSDFVKTPKRADTDSYTALSKARAFYNPSFNYVQMSPVEMSNVPYNATLAHEIMHKGAELLRKTSGQDLGKLRTSIMSKGPMDKAEHRYIQSLVNKAYVDRLINNQSIYSNKGLRFYKEQLKDFPNDEFYKEQVKNYEGYLKRNRNEALVDESKRVFNFYMTDKNKEEFINRVKPILEENNILTYFLSGDYDYDEASKALETMPFETSKAIFDIANSVMGEDYITQKFAENMRKSESSRLTEGYPSYFPEQIPPGYDLYTPKAEGGVIGLKDKAVNMYRNRV